MPQNRFTKTSKQILFISSVAIGVLLDYICFLQDWAFNFRISFFQAVNFIISIPLFMYFLIWILNLTKIKNKIAITFLAAIISYLCLCFTTLFFNIKGAYQIDAMIYLFGSFTAAPIGIVYGLYISFTIDHIPYEWPET